MDVELKENTHLEHPVIGRIRRFFSAKQLFECLQPLFFLLYCHGLVPFYIHSDSHGHKRMKQSAWGYVNVALHIVVYGACYTLTLLNDFETVAGYFFSSHISHFGDFMQILSGFLGVMVIYLTAIIPKYYVQRSMAAMQDMDYLLRDMGIKIMYSKILRFSYIYILTMVTANLTYTIGSFRLLKKINEAPSWSLHVTFILQHTVVLFAVSMFSCFTRMIEMRYNMMHQVLKNLSHQWDTRSIKAITQKQRSLQCLDSFSMYTIVSKNPSEIIQESMEIHQLICEAASTANKYFTYQLLTIISIAFLIIVFDAYYVLETLLGKSKRESKFKTVEFVTFFSCQMILYLIAIISIVEGSNRAIKKSEKTGGIVHALLNKAKTPEVKEKLQQFSMQLLHLKISFTAAGLFNIDRTLYFTISGALTTYLIILLQFTSSGPQSLCDNGNSTAIANLTQH
ncbi:putative gustatory receptor 28b [Musca vetustissima]|uniref:putative gustatory receptor 28b n=1 Tax=Musca vetustissima TaxID=27455 RepID=UPI002AB660B8|nr:putative gustatory receptor 28b [Musca vetustissima]